MVSLGIGSLNVKTKNVLARLDTGRQHQSHIASKVSLMTLMLMLLQVHLGSLGTITCDMCVLN